MNKLGGIVSLLFVIGSGYLNDNIVMESILDIGHFFIASYSRKKTRPTFYAGGRYAPCYCYLPLWVETVCNLRLVELNYSFVYYAAIEMAQ